jgi:hypothetical protein
MKAITLGLRRAAAGRRMPNLIYNFMVPTLPSGLIYTRASVATDVINGVLTQFASGQPRISPYNGYLSEGSRTNSLRNGQAGNSVSGVIGSGGAFPTNWNDINTVGLTREIVDSGTINGFSYVDLRISGTPSAGTYELLFDAATQIAAASGQIWTGSFYIALIAGSLTGITTLASRISGRLAGVETEGTSQNFVPTIDPTRVFVTRTLNGGTTDRVISELTAAVTAVPIDATFRIAACQLEQGFGVTSYIPTTSAAVTRAADVLSRTTASIPGYSTTQGSLVVTGKTAPFYHGGVTGQTAISLSGSGDFIYLSKFAYASARLVFRLIKSYAEQAALQYTPALGLNENFKASCAWAHNNIAVSVNGGSPVTGSSMAAVPTGSNIYIGLTDTVFGEHFFGYIKSMAYYNERKSNAELQVL